jgi:hypothetical protein
MVQGIPQATTETSAAWRVLSSLSDELRRHARVQPSAAAVNAGADAVSISLYVNFFHLAGAERSAER